MFVLFVTLVLSRCPGPAPVTDAQVQWVVEGLKPSLAGITDAPVAVRDDFNAAWAHLLIDGSREEAEALVRRGLALEILTGDNAGSFLWREGDKAFSDPNALEFALQSLGPMLVRHEDCLSHALKKDLRERVPLMLQALARDGPRIHVAYTNIWLMNASALGVLGGWAKHAPSVALARERMDQWLALVSAHGVTEFDSPTYYAADLDSLFDLVAFAADEGLRQRALKALDVLWADMAANYFPARQSLSGAHSRDYDFLHGRGGVQAYFQGFGWSTADPLKKHVLDLEKVALLAALQERAYSPARWQPLAMRTPKTVEQRWENPEKVTLGAQRINFVTRDFSVSSVSADYVSTAQFKPFAVELNGSPVVLSINPQSAPSEAEDDPYGLKKRKDCNGHDKPHHLQTEAAIVQHGATLLGLFSGHAVSSECAKHGSVPAQHVVVTHVIVPLPSVDAVAVNGKPLHDGEHQSLHSGDVLSSHTDHAAVLVRIFAESGCAGPLAKIEWISDAEGRAEHAGRIDIIHGQSKEDLTGCAFHFGLVAQAVPLPDLIPAIHALQTADLTSMFSGDKASGEKASATLKLNGALLDVSRELGAHGELKALSRKVDGEEQRFGVLQVNGQALLP